MTDRVLVTGASGFIAKNCIAALLNAGYAVRGTVRSTSRKPDIDRALKAAGVVDPDYELVEADLLADDGWEAALADCQYVLHVASPFPSKQPKDPEDLIRPAREGAVRVIKAAAAAGTKRVVQTSSIVAIMHCGKPDGVKRTEDDWTDATRTDISAYARSKTLAERAAWDEIAKLGDAAPEFATVNPGLVLGPALDPDLSTSHVILQLLGGGAYPAVPKVSYPIVDVRDVAHQHVVALTHPEAAGKRWLSCNGTLSMLDICHEVLAELPDLRRKVPNREVPSPLARLVALFDRNLKAVQADLGKANLCDNTRAVETLGMGFRDARLAVRDAASSLRSLKII